MDMNLFKICPLNITTSDWRLARGVRPFFHAPWTEDGGQKAVARGDFIAGD